MKRQLSTLKYLGFIIILFISCENKENLTPNPLPEEYKGYVGCVPLTMHTSYNVWTNSSGWTTQEGDREFIYENGKLVSITETSEDIFLTDEFIYSGELLDSIKRTYESSEKTDYHKYAYDSNDRLIKILHVVKKSSAVDYDTVSNSEITYGSNGYEKIFTLNWGSSRELYRNLNTNNIDSLKFHDSNGYLQHTKYYEYDNNGNLHLNLNKHRLYNYSNLINSSANNKIKETTVYRSGDTLVRDYDYFYTENGYPSQITMSADGEISYVFTIEYTNCE
jgi:hypothetical protein